MAEQKKLPGVAARLLPFTPWVVYGVASGFNHWRVATGGGLILCAAYLAATIRRGGSLKLMDWTPLGFFVLASVLTLGLRSNIIPAYSAVVVWSCFAIAAWSSVAVGRPFTAAYARETAPPEFWEHPVFVRLNYVMTLAWCGLMTVNVAIAVTGVIVGGVFGQVGLGLGLPMVLLICGFAFNTRFPARYLARSDFQIPAAGAPAA